MNREVVAELLRTAEEEREDVDLALATVIKSHGSAPREAGATMLIREDGSIVSTIGGGAVEKEIIERAQEMMVEGERTLRETFDLSNQEVARAGGICGGKVDVLVEVLDLRREENTDEKGSRE